MKFVRILLIFIILGYTALCLLMYFFQEKLIFFSENLPQDYEYDFPSEFEELFINSNGIKLNALHFTVNNPKGVILYFHGNAGSLAGWGQIAYDFLPRGYDVFIYDYRGYGKSGGMIKNERQLLDDAKAIYNYLLKKYSEKQIILYGRSIGCGMAIFLAKEKNPAKLLLETPYSSLTQIAKHHYPILPTFLLKYKLNANKWISKVKIPIFIFHGTNDDVIPIRYSKELVEYIQQEYIFFEIEGGRHNNLSSFNIYFQNLEFALGL